METSEIILSAVENLAKEGKSQADIAMMLGCAKADPKNWFKRLRKQYPDIDEAYKAGATMVNMELVRSAAERALFGYDYVEEEIEYESIGDGSFTAEGKPVLIEIPRKRIVKKKHKPADNALLKFLLMNRMPELFRDKKEVEVTDPKTVDEGERIENFAGNLMKTVLNEEPEVTEFEKNDEQGNDSNTVL